MHTVFRQETTLHRSTHRKRLWLAMSLLACILTANASDAADEPTLVLSDPTEPPYTTKAGNGFFDVIAGEAFRRAGLRLRLVKLPAERGLINANDGIEDGDLSRISGLEKNYPNLVRVPEKMMDMDFVAFARQAKPVEASWGGMVSLSSDT